MESVGRPASAGGPSMYSAIVVGRLVATAAWTSSAGNFLVSAGWENGCCRRIAAPQEARFLSSLPSPFEPLVPRGLSSVPSREASAVWAGPAHVPSVQRGNLHSKKGQAP